MENKAPSHASRGHHPFGPSGLGSLAASPCYLSRSGNTEASLAGTAQHEATESAELPPELSDEQANAVARALSMVTELKGILLRMPDVEIFEFTEQYLHVDDAVVDGWLGSTGGFPDKVIIAHNRRTDAWKAFVLDWKFGAYAVTDAKENMQGWGYLLGTAHLLRTGKLIPGVHAELQGGTVVFFSPHRDEEPSQHDFEASEFPAMLDEIRTTVTLARVARERIERDGIVAAHAAGLLRTSVKTCCFCARQAGCPALAALAAKIAHRTKPAVIPADLTGVFETDPKALALGLQVAGAVDAWAKNYRAKVTARAFEHPETETPAGYKLIASWPARVLKPIELLAKLTERFGKAAEEHVTVPLTPFDKMVSLAAPRGEKGSYVETFRAELEEAGLVEKSSNPVISLRMQ